MIEYPTRLYKALMNSSTVISAWDGDRLVGLIRVLDDSELVAYMHYVLVHPDYHGRGIAGHMVELVKGKVCRGCEKLPTANSISYHLFIFLASLTNVFQASSVILPSFVNNSFICNLESLTVGSSLIASRISFSNGITLLLEIL